MRILITGPECTGKSSLARQLSKELNLPWFPEFARTYLETHGAEYNQEDIVIIAQKHHQLVQVFAPDQPLIMDTYLLNLKLWSEIRYGEAIPWIDEQLAELPSFDFILLMEPDLPWVQDGLRENPDSRQDLFTRYQLELKKLGWVYNIVNGLGDTRLNKALEIIQG